MAQPSTRQELIDYVLRKLGAPVLEINVAQEQIEDLVDDAIQFFQERHFDGVIQTYLKYVVTQEDIDRGKARPPGLPTGQGSQQSGITTESVTTSIVGTATTFTYYENSNYLEVPSSIIGVNKVWKFDGITTVNSANMFNIKYQMFLNDIYYWGNMDLLSYSMAMSYLETMDFLLDTHKQIRFNQRQDRLYLDVDFGQMGVGEVLIIDCWRHMDPSDYARVWNDSFLKRYVTALVKRQWGQNLIKFQGMKLPGGMEFNGRQLYDDAQTELDKINEEMMSKYEIPPLDIIG
jgi:hypothetical protein